MRINRNYFQYRTEILQAISTTGMNKRQLATAIGMNPAAFSLNPGKKALEDLVLEGKVHHEGGAYRCAVMPISNRQDVNSSLQSALASFLAAVVSVVSEDYERQFKASAQNLTDAYGRISELTSELARYKYESHKLPNVMKKLEEQNMI